jgi:serine/threonine-protein kinase
MLVYRFVHGKLTPQAAEDVDRHAQRCAECRELIASVTEDPDEDDDAAPRTTPPPAARPTAPLDEEARALFSAFARPQQDRSGHLIADKYRLVRRLGAGGMGVVYEATNTRTDRQVALKLLHPWFSSDPETVSRFRREARSATRIKHPSVVDVLDIDQDPSDGSLYMVQELLAGETLRQHLSAKGRLSVAEAARILEPIMEGLAAAHEAGVVHRDVKPENIVLSVDHTGAPAPKLIDFGISKITAGDVAQLSQTDRVIGTPLYMSPEQLHPGEGIDGRTDVWAVGVLLFELLAGRRPFDAAGRDQVVAKIATADAELLQAHAADVPDAMAAVVARALRRKKEARFCTMRAMLVAFRAAVATPAQVRAPSPRRPLRWLLLLALALLALGAVTTLARRRTARPTAAPSIVTLPAPSPAQPSLPAPSPPAMVAAPAPSPTPPPPTATRRRSVRPRPIPSPVTPATEPSAPAPKPLPILDI